MGYDLVKLPPGTLASFTGENIRSGDLLAFYAKNLFKHSDTDKVELVRVVANLLESRALALQA